MTRRYLWLSIFCASIMFCLASNSPLTRALWRLSFVPEAAARQTLAARPAGAPVRTVAPGVHPIQPEAARGQE